MVRNLTYKLIAIILFLGSSIALFMCFDADYIAPISTVLIVITGTIVANLIALISWIHSTENTENK